MNKWILIHAFGHFGVHQGVAANAAVFRQDSSAVEGDPFCFTQLPKEIENPNWEQLTAAALKCFGDIFEGEEEPDDLVFGGDDLEKLRISDNQDVFDDKINFFRREWIILPVIDEGLIVRFTDPLPPCLEFFFIFNSSNMLPKNPFEFQVPQVYIHTVVSLILHHHG